MHQEALNLIKSKLSEDNYIKITRINNSMLHKFIAEYVELCNPAEVFICADSEEDIQYIRNATIKNREEVKLAIEGHTVHFDGYYDQARDKKKTKFLLPKGVDLGPEINAVNKEEGINEIHSILRDIMIGKELFVKFFSLGPRNSEFSLPCVQLTDSSYVAHSEDLLYRNAYDEFVRLGNYEQFFKFVHSQGELKYEEHGLGVSKNMEKRRIYIDLQDEIIYSTNTQYGGNTIGLKKLALRLAINRASKEGWLAEHMLITGVRGPRDRISYFTGAFPSMCGKTSTATLDSVTIVGDDIAYLKKVDGKARVVNAEKGMFGIIEGINSTDDQLIWKALHKPCEIIFSNVLVTKDGDVFWNGKDDSHPKEGINHSGKWSIGKVDAEGNKILASHKNARFTFDLKILENLDPKLDDPEGYEVNGIIYGGRDSDTWVPLEESFDWAHGIITKGAALESETTAATLGEEGVRKFNPMSNLDFLSIPIGKYIKDNLNFGLALKNPPKIFSVNYFLKNKDGKFLNSKNDKLIWLQWMELRVNEEVDAMRTPTGLIPRYQDLRELFYEIMKKDYTEEDYTDQFSLRIHENLAKIDRLIEIYTSRVLDTPKIVFKVFEEQKRRLEEAKEKFGDYISPDNFSIL